MGFKKVFFALGFAISMAFGLMSPTSTRQTTCPDGVHSVKNAQCCRLFNIRDDLLNNLFNNTCAGAARAAIRLVFHDAIGIDPIAGRGGGADGSIFTYNTTELKFPPNRSLANFVLNTIGPYYSNWTSILSAGDFIQFAGALALSVCPGAPQVKFVMGRPNATEPSPPDLIPEAFHTVTTILNRFASVGFDPLEVVALLASHSVARTGIDCTVRGAPLDITPDKFDTQFFIDVQLRGTLHPGTGMNVGEAQTAVNGTFRLQSDHYLARDPRTSCAWQSFADNQDRMAYAFGQALFKLSLLGQQNYSLTDCSDVIPAPPVYTATPSFPPSLKVCDIEQACATAPFPNLPTRSGPPILVPGNRNACLQPARTPELEISDSKIPQGDLQQVLGM